MIRLAIIGGSEMRLPDVARRLRGVALHAGNTLSCEAVVCLTRVEHRVIEELLDAGKHVVLSSEVRWSIETLRALSNPRLGIVNPDRYLPSRQLIRQQLDAGKLGEVGLIRVHRWGPATALLSDLDLVQWYFGGLPNLVFAVDHTVGIQVQLGFPGGGMALLESNSWLPPTVQYFSLSLIGSSGAAYIDDHQNMQLHYRGDDVFALRTEEGLGPLAAMLQAFADTLTASAKLAAAPDWLKVLAIQEALQQSLRTKQAVALPEGA
jgi:predicted dehydrogenase